MAVPGPIVDLSIERMEPDDFGISFTLESGETLHVCGRDVFDPPEPFADAVELWSFLLMQNPPVDLLVQALNAVDPHWEERVHAFREAQPDSVRRREEDQSRRSVLREEFRRGRAAPT